MKLWTAVSLEDLPDIVAAVLAAQRPEAVLRVPREGHATLMAARVVVGLRRRQAPQGPPGRPTKAAQGPGALLRALRDPTCTCAS